MSEKDIIFNLKDSDETPVPGEDQIRRTVDTREEKKYAEHLRDEHKFGLTTINTYLRGMKRYKTWKEEGS